MSDDDRPGQNASGGRPQERAGASVVEPVVLPEHASAYYSPRSPPAATQHRTLEVAAVRLDHAVDPRLADTHRVSVDGLEPPPWLAPAPQSDAPTVLLPIVRARRFRKRATAGVLAALVGSALGVWFGLRNDPGRSETALPRAATPSVHAALPSGSLNGQTGVLSVPSTAPSVGMVASSEATLATVAAEARAGVPIAAATRAHAAPKRASSAAPAWFKPEPPKAWIK